MTGSTAQEATFNRQDHAGATDMRDDGIDPRPRARAGPMGRVPC
jgi:hypothetical protein